MNMRLVAKICYKDAEKIKNQLKKYVFFSNLAI